MTSRAAIYARISVTTEESVSIEDQVQRAQQYAAARGWEVVGTFVDDGVSATQNRPEDRPGWRALLDAAGSFDAVVVLKVDRLARRVLDFLHADAALQERGAGIVAVAQTIDMTTAEGRGFATMLAVFGEMEAAAISARVAAARRHLVRAGRVVGGKVLYGWRSVPNPNGAGLVVAQDPARIEFVREAALRVIGGATVYSTALWLDEAGAPTPSGRGERWNPNSIERILRHPQLAGMTPFNPGNDTKVRGTEVLRDENGLPVVDESVAVLTPGEWRGLVKCLDERTSAQSRPRATRSATSALLSGLLTCGECTDAGTPQRMWRNNRGKSLAYYCPKCHQLISNVEDYVVAEFLRQKGDHDRLSVVVEVHEGGATVLPEIEARLSDLGQKLQETDDDGEADALTAEIANLRKMRREARAIAPTVTYRPLGTDGTFREEWEAAETVDQRRAVLDDALYAVTVRRGRTGRGLDTSRFRFTWKNSSQVGPEYTPADDELRAWAE